MCGAYLLLAHVAHGIGATPNKDVALHEGRSESRRIFHENLNDIALQSFRHFRHRHVHAESLAVNGKMDACIIHVADVPRIQGNCAAELPVSNGNDVFRTRHGAARHKDFFVFQF